MGADREGGPLPHPAPARAGRRLQAIEPGRVGPARIHAGEADACPQVVAAVGIEILYRRGDPGGSSACRKPQRAADALIIDRSECPSRTKCALGARLGMKIAVVKSA